MLFTRNGDDIYVTFAQDPSAIDIYSNNWSQLKVPAQVLLFTPFSRTFEVIQQLDIDRVVALANLDLNGINKRVIKYVIQYPMNFVISSPQGDPFMAVATFTGVVRIYRLIQGQGFQSEQTFNIGRVKSIAGYSIRNQTFLATITDSRFSIFVARLRGPQKPILKL